MQMVILIVVSAVAGIMLFLERVRAGRSWPQVPGWWRRAALFNAAQVVLVLITGVVCNNWMLRHRLWSANGLGLTGGALVGYFVITFVYYWWHRWRHESPFLWRCLHQVHHSAQRLEVLTSFYKHPVEIFANCLLTSVILYWLVGLGPAAASLAVLLTGLGELFYHWNFNTHIGSATSSSAPRVIACIIRKVFIRITILICHYGICSLERSVTRVDGRAAAASGQKMSIAYWRC